MKISLRIDDQRQQQQQQSNGQNPLLLHAKIPLTVFGLPFLSGFSVTGRPTTAASSSDLSLSLRTNFPSGPSLKLSYSPTAPTTTTSSTAAGALPLTLTLKSGISLSGSPNNSPLIISAHFSFSPHGANPNPTFSLQFKPQFGDFSFRKITFSNPNPNPSPKPNGEVNSMGFVPVEGPMAWKDLTLEPVSKDSIFSGVAVMAKTALPLASRVALNFRWGVNFPADFGKQLPFLTVNKIGIERTDEVKEVNKKSNEGNVGDLEMVKGMYSWMRKELDCLRKENKEMRHTIEEMKLGQPVKNDRVDGGIVANNSLPPFEMSSGFEQRKSKKNSGEENGKKDAKKMKVNNQAKDVEGELQKALKAAST